MERLHMAPGEAALERLRQREPFATILAYDANIRTHMLEGVLHALEDSAVHVIRLANPLRAPLTMERILIQLAGFQGESSQGEDTDAVLRAVLNQMHAGRDRLVISIEQAETLQPMALLLLDQIARPIEPGGPSPQVLFTGTPALARALGHPLLGRMRAVLGLGTPDPIIVDAPPEIEAPQSIPVPEPPRPLPEAALPLPKPSDEPRPAFPAAAPLGHTRVGTVSALPPASMPAPARRPLTARQVRAQRSRSGRLQWIAWLLLMMIIAGGGIYSALAMHVLPTTIETPLVQALEQAQAWLAGIVASARGRLLSPAALLY